MQAQISPIAFLLAALALPAFAQTAPAAKPAEPLPPETVLIEDGKVRVNAADFEGNILRVPENQRGSFRMSYERVVSVVDNIFVTRSVAQKARDAGLDKDPAVQARLQQLQDGFLADMYVQKLEKEGAGGTPIDIEARAREIYTVDREKYRTDEETHIQQILIGEVCRTREAALELAAKAAAEARAGKNFLELAAKYSDPGEKANKGGDVGVGSTKRLVEPVRNVVAKLKPGEISDPVESQFGVHVIKLIERKPGQQKSFDAVKGEIIAAERDAMRKKRVEDSVRAVRSSTTVTTHRGNVEKLVSPGADLNEITEKARAANRGS